ncbi:MAG: TetR/AcrR family transcriptional regulator [Planctomycetota bacterium]|nr:TetR/AcrR family transcriptional regulator [Planctomycetota bacterium]
MTNDDARESVNERSSDYVVPNPAQNPPCKIEGQAKSKQGRPRDKAVHQNILECTRELAKTKLAYKDISFEAVAKEAKVAKSTLYRWWENKAELIREACFLDTLRCPDTGGLLSDLEDLVRQEIVAQTTSTSRPVFAALVAELIALNEAAECEVPCPYQANREAMLAQIFEQASARGEWAGEIDAEAAYENLFSVIFYHCIGRNQVFEPADVTRHAGRIRDEARMVK